MKKILALMGMMLMNHSGYACDEASKIPLDKVTFQVSAKSWVNTKMVLLIVNVNVSATHSDLVKTRDEVLQSLNQIAKGEWHITQFERSQDSSGLDKLFVSAEVRLPQPGLGDVYARAKVVSKAGAAYVISGMDFKPDLPEVQDAKAALRQKLYGLVNLELANLNKAYAEQHYTVNRIYILDGDMPFQPQAAQSEQGNKMLMRVAGAAPAITVSNELVMTAVVEAASNRTGGKSVETVPGQ